VAGDITRTEYQALCELRQNQKPIILVFNKIDLYPDQDREAIYRQLQQLGTGSPKDRRLQKTLTEDEIVMVAAEPAPLEVRVEWPDGRVTYEWETPPAQIDELKQKIFKRDDRCWPLMPCFRRGMQRRTWRRKRLSSAKPKRKS